jgi:hypothetical protein
MSHASAVLAWVNSAVAAAAGADDFQQGALDWFCFWLRGEVDPDRAKSGQYVGWRELVKMQESSQERALKHGD